MVATVGTISFGSPGQRTMARLTPSSLKLSTASRATMATANVPNSAGPSSRASTMPMASVLSLPTTVLTRLQPRARDACPNRESPSLILMLRNRLTACPPSAPGGGTGRGHGVEVVGGRPAPRPRVLAAHLVADHGGRRAEGRAQRAARARPGQRVPVDALLHAGRALEAETVHDERAAEGAELGPQPGIGQQRAQCLLQPAGTLGCTLSEAVPAAGQETIGGPRGERLEEPRLTLHHERAAEGEGAQRRPAHADGDRAARVGRSGVEQLAGQHDDPLARPGVDLGRPALHLVTGRAVADDDQPDRKFGGQAAHDVDGRQQALQLELRHEAAHHDDVEPVVPQPEAGGELPGRVAGRVGDDVHRRLDETHVPAAPGLQLPQFLRTHDERQLGGRNGATPADITVHTAAAGDLPNVAKYASSPGGHSYPCTTSMPRSATSLLSIRMVGGSGRRLAGSSSTCSSPAAVTRSTSGPGSLTTMTSCPRSRTAAASSMALSWLPPTSMVWG